MRKLLLAAVFITAASYLFASWEGGFENDNRIDPYSPKILDKLLAEETSVLKIPVLFAIRTYQRMSWNTASTNSCNFYPSCSRYGFMAVKDYGGIKGTLMAGERFMRCNPWADQANYPVDYEHGLFSDPVEYNSTMNWLFDFLNF